MLSVAVGRWARRQVVVARNDERQANIATIDAVLAGRLMRFVFMWFVGRIGHYWGPYSYIGQVLEAFAWVIIGGKRHGFLGRSAMAARGTSIEVSSLARFAFQNPPSSSISHLGDGEFPAGGDRARNSDRSKQHTS